MDKLRKLTEIFFEKNFYSIRFSPRKSRNFGSNGWHPRSRAMNALKKLFRIFLCSTQAKVISPRLKKIESSKYDGTDRRSIASIARNHPFGLTVFENHLYYTDWYKLSKGVKSLNKFTGMNKTLIKRTLWSHMDIHVYHPLRQPNGKLLNIATIPLWLVKILRWLPQVISGDMFYKCTFS